MVSFSTQALSNQEASNVLSSFSGFPSRTLLEVGGIPIEEIAELALREGQSTNPLYRIHRWFARRLGSQFRSIMVGLCLGPDGANHFWDAYIGDLKLDGMLVLDPFVGGGTSLVEAIRCNANVIGYDIDPVATFITRFELGAANYNPDNQIISEICSKVADQMKQYHITSEKRDILHHFWVECRKCCKCKNTIEIHPHYRLAYNKDKGLQWAFCKDCHAVYELPLSQNFLNCKCGNQTCITQGTLNRGNVICPTCETRSNLASGSPEPPKWQLFAQEYLDRTGNKVVRSFKKASSHDIARYNNASRLLIKVESHDGPFVPERLIPDAGRFDSRPLIHGFKMYRDLFNKRQLLHLTLLGKAIRDVKDKKVRYTLSMAFSDHLAANCMYASYAFGYRRLSPLFAIHSYRHITRPVEINPWLNGIGRGTFPNSLNKIARARKFAIAPRELNPTGGHGPYSNRESSYAIEPAGNLQQIFTGIGHSAIITQSSENLNMIPDGSIGLILTDPPYFDNISYSELSDFYLAWHQSLGIAEHPYDDPASTAPISENLALKEQSKEAISIYRSKLLRILSECNRVLRTDGIGVFTYHHKSPQAWYNVGEALARSGLRCTSVLPLRSEGRGGLHSYNGTIKWDAVLVCRKGLAKKNDQGVIWVPEEAIRNAELKTAAYADRLQRHQRIGFREPDVMNLKRAMLIASAEVGEKCVSGAVPLSTALRINRSRSKCED